MDNFFQFFFIISRNTKILIESSVSLGMYVSCILETIERFDSTVVEEQ